MPKFKAPRKVRVFLIDDQPLTILGLSSLIASNPDLEVCGSAVSIPSALTVLHKLKPDMVITEVVCTASSGFDDLRQLRASTTARILVHSSRERRIYAPRVYRLGAHGFVSKAEPLEEVALAILCVAQGEVYMDSHSLTQAKLALVGLKQKAIPMESLSNRELEVFELIGEGLRTVDIAQKLGLSIKTIEAHRENIKQKLDLKSSSEVFSLAVQYKETHAY